MAASLGISITWHQALAFAISGALAGLFGGLEAYHSYALDPNQFGFHLLITVLSYVILGGRNSVIGPLIGTAILIILPELARPLAENRMIIYWHHADHRHQLPAKRHRRHCHRQFQGAAVETAGGVGMSTLTLTNLSKYFGGVVASKDVNMQVPAGEITGLIGPNGAGKTTIVNMITGMLPVSDGTIQVGDTDITPRAGA